MTYSRFLLAAIIRLAVFAALLTVLLLVVVKSDLIILPILLTVALAGSGVEMVRFMDRMKDNVLDMLMAVKHGESGHSPGPADLNDPIRKAIAEVEEEITRLRLERESHYQYLQAVIQHIGVALICYNRQGHVTLFNEAFSRLFRMPYIRQTDALGRISEVLLEHMRDLDHGQRNLLNIEVEGEVMNLSMHASVFRLQDEDFKLVSFQNIKSELDEQELESWHKLIRVLTHEITNSVMPIATLSQVINRMVEDENGQARALDTLDPEDVDDMRTGLKTIESRARGLMEFVKGYRSMTLVPKATLKLVPVRALLESVLTLMKPQLEEHQITLQVHMEQHSQTIMADREQLEQVLINLLLNAKDAVKDIQDKRTVTVSQINTGSEVWLRVQDNGRGMDREVLQNIFVPFYTTKAEGSGIGLSLSRQIMRQHKGRIRVQSQVGSGTTITLVFPAPKSQEGG
jgi:two-component system, NtrC family, nitrogen regulation sensor histidine kinase NtrY